MRRALRLLIPAALLVGGVILGQSTVKNPHGKLAWDCQDCHTTTSWSDIHVSSKFDHSKTGFALLGAHASAQCIGCHKDPVFSHVGIVCVDCHADHHGGKLGIECQNCHTPLDWQNRRDMLDLHAARGFPLMGAHAVADCDGCHRGQSQQKFAGTPIDCYGCHAQEYAATTDPNHTQVGFSVDCGQCHTPLSPSWQFADVSHPSSFPLTGGHRGLPCRDCHAGGFVGTPTACYACHQAAFEQVQDPNHVSGNFDHDCRKCHNTVAWSPATFDHAATGFPLTGKHLTAACSACHATQYAGTPTACYACHQAAYESVTDPNHVTGNFDHNCALCHTTSGWSPSTFDHSTTGFALTGKHATASCIACHGSGYAGTPTACYACHQADYTATSNPNHAAAAFPTTCQNCHATSGWTPANWDHDGQYFPIYSGRHAGVWTVCADCHVNPSSFAVFECINCHTHNKTDTDAHHTQVANYQYLSTACYSCHPRGVSGG